MPGIRFRLARASLCQKKLGPSVDVFLFGDENQCVAYSIPEAKSQSRLVKNTRRFLDQTYMTGFAHQQEVVRSNFQHDSLSPLRETGRRKSCHL